jgi:signal transduction histidine kinase
MLERMAWHTPVSAVACAGHLAFALVIWLRRDRGNIAVAFPLSLLFLDTFVWTFADLAYSLTGVTEWHWLDHAFSTFLPVLSVQVIAAFVGKARALRSWLWGLYACGAVIASLAATSFWWWRIVLGFGVGLAAFCGLLLVQHWARSLDSAERGRTKTLLLAVVLGTLLTLTDLCPGGWQVPKISNIGMLVTLSLVAVSVLRLRLLGDEVPGLFVAYALLGAALLSTAILVLVRSLPSQGTLLGLLLLSGLTVAIATVREVARVRAGARDRVEKLVALGRFSEQLAHDLRNPLAALKGAIQFLLVERQQGRSIDQQGSFLSLMLEQVERTSRVLDAYQRIANVQPMRVSMSLNELVERVLELQRFASTPAITVQARLDPGLPACELDPELLQTTLENLLRNAFDAMPSGGAVTVETCAMPGNGGAAGVSLSVIDQGHGMDARVLERATDQFYTTKAAGSGLGLNFVERVARAHQGRLDLSSEVGRGTIVRLWMPLRPSC